VAAYDIVIRNGQVADGTGKKLFAADVAIKGDRIAAVEAPGSLRGDNEIDARNKVVAPGFIDVHTHSEDITSLPLAENFLRMGVTTIVTGNCGTSRVDVAEFFDAIRRTGVGPNVATLVGQGSVRGQVMGGSFMRPATPAEVDRMRDLVAKAMADGANEPDNDKRGRIFRTALDRVNEQAYLLPISSMPWVFAHTKEVRVDTNRLKANAVEISDIFWK